MRWVCVGELVMERAPEIERDGERWRESFRWGESSRSRDMEELEIERDGFTLERELVTERDGERELVTEKELVTERDGERELVTERGS